MKEIKRYKLVATESNSKNVIECDDGHWVHYSDVEQLQARIKELESDKRVLSIRNQANLFMIGHIVDDLEDENDIQKIKDYLYLKLNYYQEKVNNQ